MAASSPARRRLARLMDLRRAELRRQWQDVADKGGVSVATLRRIRNSDVEITADNEVAIEDGLDWQRGSVTTIVVDGGDPTPRPGSEPDPAERAWDALRTAYEAERVDKGPDAAWTLLRRGVAAINKLVDQRHADRERRETG